METTGKKSARTSRKQPQAKKKTKKVLVLMSVNLHEKVSHMFSVLHATLVPYLMWVKREDGLESVPVDVSGIEFLWQLPWRLQERRAITIPEGVSDEQFQFLDQGGDKLSRGTLVEGLATSENVPLIVRFVSSDTA